MDLILYSKIRDICINYHVTPTRERDFSLSDAVQLALPFENANSINSLHILPATYIEKLGAKNCLGRTYSQTSLQYFNLIVLRRSLSLEQSVFYTVARNRTSHVCWTPFIWETSKRHLKNRRQVVDDEFFVDDSDVQDVEPMIARHPPKSAYIQRRLEQSTTKTGIEWTVGVERTAAELNDADVEHVTDFDQIVEDVSELLRNNDDEDRLKQPTTLRELAEGEVTVGDLGAAVIRFQSLQSSSQDEDTTFPESQAEDGTLIRQSKLRRIDIPESLNLAINLGDLSATYGDISRDWIANLPENLSELARSTKEQLAKRMAAEVFLAGHILLPDERLSEQTKQTQPDLSIEEKVDEWNLPMRSAASGAASSSQIQHGTPRLPTPSNTMPSRATTPSAMTSTSLPSTHITHDITHLTKYTTFSKPALPRYTSRVLAHWDPGTDPSDYDWQQASRALLRRDENVDDDENGLTDQQRRTIERRAKRHVQRQRQEAAQSQRQQLLSSQAPEIFSASQPQQRRNNVNMMTENLPSTARTADDLLRSSQTVPGFSQGNLVMPASQILPGRHGGRGAPVRKKRKSGF